MVCYASLFKAMGNGRVIGVGSELRPHNRKARAEHLLSEYMTIVDRSSTALQTVENVRSLVGPGEGVMVMLNSCHTKSHVLEELRAYGPMVTPGFYIVAADEIMELVAGAPRTQPEWRVDNPRQAALAFAAKNRDFVIEEPEWPFNEGLVRERVTYWPGAFVKRPR